MSAPFIRHNLSISDALARSGVKGGQIPQFLQGVQPVIILANFSQTYSGEPLEGRGIAADLAPACPIGQRSYVRLHSFSPGGLVIENLSAVDPAFPFATQTWLDIVDEIPAGTTFEAAAQVLQSGGTPAVSDVFHGHTTAVPSGAGPMDNVVFNPQALIRMYVPNGTMLWVITDAVSDGTQRLGWRFVWREIPAPIAGP